MHGRNSILIIVVLCLLLGGVAVLPSLLKGKTRPLPLDGDDLPAAAFPMTVTDCLKRTVTIAKRPQRIISLAPSVTEILFAIGVGDRVVADTTFCDYPPEAARKAKVGGYGDPNVEKIVALNPDIVLGARGNPREVYDKLQSLGVPVVSMDPTSLAGVFHDIRLVGRMVGDAPAGERLAASLEARRDALLEKLKTVLEADHPRTVFLFSPGEFYSVGPGSHVDELIRLAGGNNIAKVTKTDWPQLSMEMIVSADPQVLLVLQGHGLKAPWTPAGVLKRLRADDRWRGISAIKTGRVAVLDDDEITLPGPRLVDGLEAMAAALHPALFADGRKP